MADQKSAGPAKKRDFLRWIIWPALAVIVLVGTFEIVAKQRANATAKAWRDALSATAKAETLRVSDLDAHLAGTPTLSESAASEATREHTPFADKTLAYTWSGLVRKYVVRVHVNRGDDPEIEAIEGP